MAIRQRHQQQQYETADFDLLQHHSGSRSDLLEHDHNALYSPYGGVSEVFVSCDGKFMQYPPPPSVQQASATTGFGGAGGVSPDYRRQGMSSTLRRPKSREVSVASSSSAAYSCCRDDQMGTMGGGGGRRSLATNADIYSTMRMSRPKHKDRSGSGGHHHHHHHHHQYSIYDDSRSLGGAFTDDYPLTSAASGLAPPSTMAAYAQQQHQHQHHPRLMSRSTDRNLDNMSDDDMLLGNVTHFLTTTAEREPPDGKEKPDQPASTKSSLLKLEASLSRKSSKCDLLEMQQQTASVSSSRSNNGANPVSAATNSSSSEAASICGDTASVLSAKASASAGEASKRDSLTGGVAKDVFQVKINCCANRQRTHFSFFLVSFSSLISNSSRTGEIQILPRRR